MFSLFVPPPTSEQIAEMRRRVEGSFEDSVAFKVFLCTPVPGLDVVAGLIAHAVESGAKDGPRDLLRDDPAGFEQDWSVTTATRAYVEKVRASGRPLIRAEVQALRNHVDLEGGVRYAVGEVVDTAAGALKALCKVA